MKQRDLLKLMKKNGWEYDRDGGSHDIYRKGSSTESIPRHREINENLAKHIIKKWNLK